VALKLAVLKKATTNLREAERFFLTSSLTEDDRMTLLEDVKYFASAAHKASVEAQNVLRGVQGSVDKYLRSL
jgi:uncharacterized protein (UPF0548 family)